MIIVNFDYCILLLIDSNNIYTIKDRLCRHDYSKNSLRVPGRRSRSVARSSGMYHRSKDCIRAAVLRIYWYEEGGPRNFVLSFWGEGCEDDAFIM